MHAAPPPTAPEWWPLPVSATLVVIAVQSVGLEPRVIPALYLAAVSPILAATDVRERRLPNDIVLPGYAAAALGLAGDGFSRGELSVLALVGGAVLVGAFLLLSVLGGVGMGDVKLAGVLGIAAGLIGLEALLVAPVAAFVLGGVAAVVALRRGRDSTIPFGPYLLAGFWIALLCSSPETVPPYSP